MALDAELAKKVVDFVTVKPRTVQEVAVFLGKNWRTADRYVQIISRETGAIATRTFREGSPGALKIVFLQSDVKIAASHVQEQLLAHILAGRNKTDFSPLDIYQYVPAKSRQARLHYLDKSRELKGEDLVGLLEGARTQVLSFSGNLSWLSSGSHAERVQEALASCVSRGVSLKVVSRVDLATARNWHVVQGLNSRFGRDAIEVRHCEQPLRGIIVDGRIARLQEVKVASSYREGELRHDAVVVYLLSDTEWIGFLERVFWRMFSASPPASIRVDAIQSIKEVATSR